MCWCDSDLRVFLLFSGNVGSSYATTTAIITLNSGNNPEEPKSHFYALLPYPVLYAPDWIYKSF